MKTYENSFIYGRDLVKKQLYACAAAGIASLFMRGNPTMQLALYALTFGLFVAIFVTIYKQCRCPHCGKVIVLGVLSVTSCPSCKRNFVTGKKVKKSKTKR